MAYKTRGTLLPQSGCFRTAPTVHPGNTPAHNPPTEACMIHSKQHRGCRVQAPGPAATGGGTQPSVRTARGQRTVRPQTVKHEDDLWEHTHKDAAIR